MGSKRDVLLAMLETDNLDPSLNYWCSLLNFSEANKKDLTIADMQMICDESERVRNYYNGDRPYTQMIFRNGEEVEIHLKKTPLDIKKEEVMPNVYQILAEKIAEEQRLQEERDLEEQEKQTNKIEIEPMEAPLPLAAAPV